MREKVNIAIIKPFNLFPGWRDEIMAAA